MRGLTDEERLYLTEFCKPPFADKDMDPWERSMSDRMRERGLVEDFEVFREGTGDDEYDWIDVYDKVNSLGRIALECDRLARGTQ